MYKTLLTLLVLFTGFCYNTCNVLLSLEDHHLDKIVHNNDTDDLPAKDSVSNQYKNYMFHVLNI